MININIETAIVQAVCIDSDSVVSTYTNDCKTTTVLSPGVGGAMSAGTTVTVLSAGTPATVLSAGVGGAMSAGTPVLKTRVFCSGVDVAVMPLAQINIKIQETRKVVFSNQHSYAADA